jgi:hypothetical protein
MSTPEDIQLQMVDARRRGAPRRTTEPYLRDLVEVLSEQPAGLRRWSVMRTMRARCEFKDRDVPQKFEDDVERTFRSRCGAETASDATPRDDQSVLFYRPKERAGEVWAVFPERAKAWLREGGE